MSEVNMKDKPDAEYPSDRAIGSHLIGRYVICRCTQAGIWAGVVSNISGHFCELTEARRLWRWKSAENETTLSGVARFGIVSDLSKIAGPVNVVLTEVCEYISTSKAAQDSIREQKIHHVE